MSYQDTPKFSIIIPTYNSASTIRETIDSIIEQHFTNFEILVIDGLSKDDTLKILNSYNDSRIHVVSEKDKGIYDAMNKGILLSKGEWLYFLGSDDILINNSILQEIMNLPNVSDFDLLYGKVLFKQSHQVVGNETNYMKMLTDQNNIPHQAIFYSKRLFQQIGLYDLRYIVYADFDLNLKCFKEVSLKKLFFDKIVAVFNELGTSQSGFKKDPFYDSIPEKYIEAIGNPPVELYHLYRASLHEVEQLKMQLAVVTNSKQYRLGKKIIGPLKYLNAILSKKPGNNRNSKQ